MKQMLICLLILVQGISLNAQGSSISSSTSVVMELDTRDSGIRNQANLTSTNGVNSAMWNYFPENRFIDSLRNDSLETRFSAPFFLQTPSRVTYNGIDPYDPYTLESFARKPRAKTWFFIVSLLVIIYILYFKAAFPKQFQLRVQSLFRPYFFEDLMREQQIGSFTGSIHAYVIGMMVFLMSINLYVLSLDYTKLNNVWVFVVAFAIASILLFALYAVQLLFTSSVEITHVLARQLQRQINVNLLLAMVFLPVFLVLYYNGSGWVGDGLFKQMYYVPIFWLSVRFLVQLLGILRDKQGLLSAFLYFCAFEIIPYLLLIKYFDTTL